MFDEETKNVILWFFKTFRFTVAFPIECTTNDTVGPVRSRSYLKMHYIWSAYLLFVTLFSGVRLLQSIGFNNSVADKVMHCFTLTCYATVVLFKLNFQIKAKEIAAFLNVCFVDKRRRLHKMGVDMSMAKRLQGAPRERVLRLICKGTTYFAFVQSLFIALYMTVEPCSPRYFLSLVPQCEDLPLAIVMPLIPYEYMLWLQAWEIFIFYIAIAVIWVVQAKHWFFIVEWQQSSVMSGEANFNHFHKLYRQFQIFNNFFNDILQELFWPTEQAIFMILLIVTYFIIIKLAGVVPIFVYACFVLPNHSTQWYTFVGYHKIAESSEKSKELLWKWRGWRKWRLIKRQVKALRAIEVKVGGFYAFSRRHSLIFQSLMVQILCTGLITIDHDHIRAGN